MTITINAQLQQKIESILQWDDLRYSKFIMECGISYLHFYIKGESEEIISHIRRSKIFWNWWKLHWAARDRAFLETNVGIVDYRLARQLYHNLHDPASLAAELYPNGQVLGESYATMIGDLNKEVVYA